MGWTSRSFPVKFNAVKIAGTIPPMNSGIRVVILISAAVLVIVAFSLSGQVLPHPDEPGGLNQQNLSDPAHPAPSFIMTVTPATAHARPGDPVDCEVLIVPQNGFNESVALHLEVDAGAVFRGTYDAGVMKPPYPKNLRVPGCCPVSGAGSSHGTRNLTGIGGGHSEDVDLVLYIES